MEDKKYAKFVIAKRIPASFDEGDVISDLWKKHDELTDKYYRLEREVDKGKTKLKDLPTPKKSYLDLKIEIASRILRACHLCTRRCGVDRLAGEFGLHCRCGNQMLVSSIFQHMGEEPELVPSGTIFTMGCTMRCIHCQNWSICVTEDTEVILGDGSSAKIAKLVDEHMERGINDTNAKEVDPVPVLALRYNGKLQPSACTGVSKRYADRLVTIQTRTGKRITVTPNHLLLTCSDGNMRWVPASSLRVGDFVATAGKVRIPTCEVVDESLARTLGYLVGDGHVSGNDIVFTNKAIRLIKDYVGSSEATFGLHPHLYRGGTGIIRAVITSLSLRRRLEDLVPEVMRRSAERVVPRLILRSNATSVAAFLQAYFDCEATIHPIKREVVAYSTSKPLLRGVQLLLLRLGMLSQLRSVRSRKHHYKLAISGNDATLFARKVGLKSPWKVRRLNELATKGSLPRQKIDLFPVGYLIRNIREKLRLSQNQVQMKVSTYKWYERSGTIPRTSAEEVRDLFCSRLKEIEKLADLLEAHVDWNAIRYVRKRLKASQRALAELIGVSRSLIRHYELHARGGQSTRKLAAMALHEITSSILRDAVVLAGLDRLKSLIESDVLWERIVVAEATERRQPVYDLHVEGVHNFVANLFVVHNSQWYESGDPYTPERLAREVESLRQKGCRNANLVGGEPTPWLKHWLETFRHVTVNVPVVWNSNSYYSEETARLLAGFADVYLTDFKYGPGDCAERISSAPGYWEACTRNHLTAKRYGELIIRILVLPKHLDCCLKPMVNWIVKKLGKNTRTNVMFQYAPHWRAHEIPELRRRLNAEERRRSIEIAREAGLTNLVP